MHYETGRVTRVTMLPEQIRRLAEFAQERSVAIEILQHGSVISLNNGSTKFSIDAGGNDLPRQQETFW